MTLEIAPPPAQSLASLNAILPRLAARTGVVSQAPLISHALNLAATAVAPAAAPAGPALSAPVYILGLDSIAARRGPSASRLAFWTHLLPSAGAEVVSADLSADTHEFAALTQGPHSNAFRQQVQTLQAPQVAGDADNNSYQLAQLRIPALHLQAVWLRGQNGAGDVLIPLEPAPPGLVAGRRYSGIDFEAALEPAARAVLAETDPLKGG